MMLLDYSYDFPGQEKWEGSARYFWIDREPLSRTFAKELPAPAADLLDVVGFIYAADRQSPRRYRGVATGQRKFNLRIPVRQPGVWSSPKLTRRLQELLWWISGDVWAFEFVGSRKTQEIQGAQRFLFDLPPKAPVSVSLFSGGLDSLAGLARHTLGSPGGTRILVSGRTHDRLAGQQKRQVRRIRAVCGSTLPVEGQDVWHVSVPYGISAGGNNNEEKGQRTRALVFLAVGAITAMQAGTNTLWVYENGIGALNLPLNATQIGTDNYRGVHPRSLCMAQELFESALGRPCRIRNPYLFTTKAEMCRSLRPTGLAEVVSETMSCDGYPQRVRKQSQCGHCTSCILRRQALHSSGLSHYDPGQSYRCDVFHSLCNFDQDQAHGFMVMSEQVKQIAGCLASENPWGKLAAAFPELLRTVEVIAAEPDLTSEQAEGNLLGLFQNHVQEWAAFSAAVGISV
jgi:hypothetical protein